MTRLFTLAAGMGRGEKIAIAGGEWRFGEPPPDAWAAPPEPHKSLVSWEPVAKVPSTELSSGVHDCWPMLERSKHGDAPVISKGES